MFFPGRGKHSLERGTPIGNRVKNDRLVTSTVSATLICNKIDWLTLKHCPTTAGQSYRWKWNLIIRRLIVKILFVQFFPTITDVRAIPFVHHTIIITVFCGSTTEQYAPDRPVTTSVVLAGNNILFAQQPVTTRHRDNATTWRQHLAPGRKAYAMAVLRCPLFNMNYRILITADDCTYLRW
jgi:hypothetical protein